MDQFKEVPLLESLLNFQKMHAIFATYLQNVTTLRCKMATHLITLWPWLSTFWPQGQCMPGICREVYVYELSVDSSSRFHFRARIDQPTATKSQTPAWIN